ncbi:hypothetical protein LCGC14_1719950 [marine sediment metagenome]|uniref:Uncharacterized protein n=1 Tax=marine sediment metagenome TaxID=412755 RepID=A0A0F9JT67_9ZZZZ|nr:MAG: hypothetical protein Lokiarch_35230 [Candidatus Lokiarchaeum sp. GC14_75]
MLNSKSIEDQVEDFLKHSFNHEDYVFDCEIQKQRFTLLSKLVADLFNCKNSTICYKNVSNLIILLLNIYNEKFPLDIYSTTKINSDEDYYIQLKNILKREFLTK